MKEIIISIESKDNYDSYTSKMASTGDVTVAQYFSVMTYQKKVVECLLSKFIAQNGITDYAQVDGLTLNELFENSVKVELSNDTMRLSELRAGDQFQYLGSDEWHTVSRVDNDRLYYPGAVSEQRNWRVDDVIVRVKTGKEVQE